MSGSIKLKHASGNGVTISAPSSNPAADRTLTLPSDADGVIAKTDASGNFVVTGDIRVGDTTDSNAGTQTISVGSVSSGSGGIGIFANPTNGNSFVQFGDGTASADQYRGYMNYQHASDNLNFGTAGSERLRINSSGQMLLGATSAVGNGTKIEARDDSNSAQGRIMANGFIARDNYGSATNITNGMYSPSSNNLAFATDSTERVKINGFGKILQFANGGENQFVSQRTGTAGSNGDFYFHLFAQNNGGTNVGGIGIVRDTANDDARMVFSTANGGTNAERLRIDSSGRVGIGTTTGAVGGAPSSQTGQFNVISSAASGQWVMQARADNAAGNGLFLRAGANSSYYTAYLTGNDENNVHMVVRGDGNVGIGTASPVGKFDVTDGTTSISFTKTGNNPHIDFKANNVSDACQIKAAESSGGGVLQFFTKTTGGTATERMSIDTLGNLLVGRTSAGNTGNGHSIRGDDGVIFSRNATGETVQICRNSSNGDFVQFRSGDSGNATSIGEISKNGGNVVYGGTSDYRLKENQVAISDGITRLKLLKPIRFNFKSHPSETVDGFFAHEVTPAVPEAVIGDKDDSSRMQSLDQSKLVPLLTAALQEAIAKIEVLETKVAALEAK